MIVDSATAAPVRRVPVSFSSGTTPLRGQLVLPARSAEGHRETAATPVVVVTGTWTSVRQQMADRYASALAERGIAALSFDHTGFGASGGTPRDYEDPALKVADIHAAVDHLAAHRDDLARDHGVDTTRLGALGVCASAGYTAVNAARDDRVRSLALVAPWLHDRTLVEAVYGGAEGVERRVTAGREAAARYADTGEVGYVPAVSATNPEAAMPFGIDFYENPARGGIPEWPNRFAVMSWPAWLTFDPIAMAPQVQQPVLLVHSEAAALPDGAHRFAAALPHPATEVWTEGTQFDFYDGPNHVALAADAAAEHFHRTL